MSVAEQHPQAVARPSLPVIPGLTVLEAYLVGYRRVWRGSVFSSFLLPMLTMLGFGVGVGSYVEGGVVGFSYLDYLVPGLLATTALQVAVGESTWPVMSNFEWNKLYAAQAAAPLRVADILGGHLAFVLFRVLTSTGVFLAVAAGFGTLHSPWALATLPVALLLALAVAAPIFGFVASISTDNYLVLLFRFGVLPMTLFAGVFFPVASLPLALRILAYASPLWHAVELSRATTLGIAAQWSIPGHLLYLITWAVLGWLLALARFRRRLVV